MTNRLVNLKSNSERQLSGVKDITKNSINIKFKDISYEFNFI